jgi:hypothetical protein
LLWYVSSIIVFVALKLHCLKSILKFQRAGGEYYEQAANFIELAEIMLPFYHSLKKATVRHKICTLPYALLTFKT